MNSEKAGIMGWGGGAETGRADDNRDVLSPTALFLGSLSSRVGSAAALAPSPGSSHPHFTDDEPSDKGLDNVPKTAVGKQPDRVGGLN